MQTHRFYKHNTVCKKLIAMLVIISIMLPASLSAVVWADNSPSPDTVELIQAEGFSGELVDVPVYVTPDEFIYKYSIHIQYDSESLELVQDRAVTNELLINPQEEFNTDVSTAGIIKMQASLIENIIVTERTKVATIHFKIKDNVPAGSIILDVTKHDLYESNEPANPSFGIQGEITVKTPRYTVIFDSTGGSLVENTPGVSKGSLINEPLSPTKDGYHFAGWYKDEALTEDWVFLTDIVNGNLTLYAKWIKDEVKKADIQIGSVSGLPGSNVQIPVTVTNTTAGIGSYGMQIDFDANALEVTSIIGGTDLYFDSNYNNQAGWLKTAWADRDGGDARIESGQTMFTVSFRIKSSAAAGEKALSVRTQDAAYFKVTNESGLDMEKTLIPGKVTVNGNGSNGNGGGSGGNGGTVGSGGTSSNGSSGSTGEPSRPSPVATSPAAPPQLGGVDVLVNGKAEQAGISVKSARGEQAVNTVHMDSRKLEAKLAAEGEGSRVTIAFKGNEDIVIGQLDAQMVKNMELKKAVLELRTSQATYTIPAQYLKPEAIARQMGSGIALQDIEVQIEVSPASAETVKRAERAALQNNLTLVAPTYDFTIRALHQNQTIEISKFDAYVERSIALPEGIDPTRITTGVVIDADGKIRHVPTKVIKDNDTYFAQINSLTNSTYSVVWHPLEYVDVADHWSKTAVNDMGSRMIIEGTGEGMFSPNRDITRAEFAAILIRGMGLAPQQGSSSFSDIADSDWYNGAVNTAVSFGLMAGYADGMFRPEDRITREQAMVVLERAMSKTGLNLQPVSTVNEEMLYPFQDTKQLADWARGAAAFNLQQGLITGRHAVELAPKKHMTRAEAAAVMQRLLKQSKLI